MEQHPGWLIRVSKAFLILVAATLFVMGLAYMQERNSGKRMMYKNDRSCKKIPVGELNGQTIYMIVFNNDTIGTVLSK